MEKQLSSGRPLTIRSSSVASLATKGLSCKVPGSCCSSYPGNLGPGPDASALSLSSREQPKRLEEYPSVSGSLQNLSLPELASSWHFGLSPFPPSSDQGSLLSIISLSKPGRLAVATL